MAVPRSERIHEARFGRSGVQRFDRAAAERILQRAIDLEDAADPSEAFAGITEDTLAEAASELGVPVEAVQQAAAEERLGVLVDAGRRLDRHVGPGAITALRIVSGDRADLLARTDAWLRHGGFRRRRFAEGAAEYARRNDIVAVAQRTVRSIGGHEVLRSITHLKVTAEAVGPGSTVLALVVDLEGQRTATVAGGSAVAGGGAAASAVASFAASSPWWWAGVPASVAAGYGVLRARAFSLRDVETELQGALDRITHGFRR